MIESEVLRHTFVVMALSLARLTAAATVVPFMGGQLLQHRMRNSIVISLGLIVFPMTFATAPADLGTPLLWLVLIGKEVVLGLLIGFFSSFVFWLAMSIGFFVDNQRGASMASVFDPMSGDQTSPLGEFLQQTVVVLFYAGGGFLVFLEMIYTSYLVWPVFSYYPDFNEVFPKLILGEVDLLMRLTVVVAAPIIITVFIAEFGLGLMNRFAPQLQVFFLAMPIKSLIAVLVLIFYMTYLMGFLESEYLNLKMLIPVLQEGVQ